jgi:hypothetical protein
MTAPACSDWGVDKKTCDESKNKIKGKAKPNRCERDYHCAFGRECTNTGWCVNK